MKHLIGSRILFFIIHPFVIAVLSSCAQTETSESVLQRGIANQRSGNFEEAYYDFTRAIELDSTNALAYLERSRNDCKTPQREDPKADLVKYVELTAPNLALAYQGIALMTVDHESALRELDKAILINPNDPWAYFYKDMNLKTLGDSVRLSDFRATLSDELSERIRRLKEERGIED
jgi:tetratricopeptide (TPR) repeat protein